MGNFETHADDACEWRHGIRADRTAAHRKIDRRAITFNYVFLKPNGKVDIDSLVVASVRVDANVSDTRLKNLERVIAQLAAKGIKVEEAKQTFKAGASSYALDELTGATWTLDRLHHASLCTFLNVS